MTGLCERKVRIEGSYYQKNITRRGKRKRVITSVAGKGFSESASEDDVEVDYKLHLLKLEDFIEHGKERYHETGVDEEDDYDPEYKLFFENLKPLGNAYILQVPRRNGDLVVKYEDELQSFDEPRRKTPYCRRKPSRKKRHNLGPKNADLPDPETKRGTRHVDGSKNEFRASRGLGRKASCRGKKSLRKHGHNLGAENAEFPEPDVLVGMRHNGIGEAVAKFINGLKVDGESYSYVDKDSNQIICEESTDESSRNSDAEGSVELPLLSSEEASRAGKATPGTSDELVPMNQKSTAKTPHTEGSARLPILGSKKTPKTSKKTLGKSDAIAPSLQKSIGYTPDTKGSAMLPLFGREKTPKASKNTLGASDKIPPLNQKSTRKTPDTEGSAKLPFLGSQKTQKTSKKTLGKSDAIAPSVQKSIGNTPDTKGSAKVPLFGREKKPDASKINTLVIFDNKICPSSQKSNGKTPVAKEPTIFPLSGEKTLETSMETLGAFDSTDPSNEKSIESSSDGFRQGVMDILAKPYDPGEHDYLLKEARIRRPMERYKETRAGNITYKDEEVRGKSYLDHHKDLKKKIKAAKRNGSSHEVLYLLRALFFWLQNVCHEDERFYPWTDKTWLEELQRRCKT